MHPSLIIIKFIFVAICNHNYVLILEMVSFVSIKFEPLRMIILSPGKMLETMKSKEKHPSCVVEILIVEVKPKVLEPR